MAVEAGIFVNQDFCYYYDSHYHPKVFDDQKLLWEGWQSFLNAVTSFRPHPQYSIEDRVYVSGVLNAPASA